MLLEIHTLVGLGLGLGLGENYQGQLRSGLINGPVNSAMTFLAASSCPLGEDKQDVSAQKEKKEYSLEYL